MGIVIARNSLLSQATRVRIGTRRLNLSTATSQITSNDQGGGGGIINRIFSWAGRLVGFLTQALGFVGFSVVEIFGWLRDRVTDFATFDWNASDRLFEAQMRSRNLAMAASWGQTLGSAFGWTTALVMGTGISLTVPVIGGAALAQMVSQGVAPEALEEVSANLVNSILVTTRALMNNSSTSLYMNFRKAVKTLPLQTLSGIFGEGTARFIKEKWGAEGGPSFTIAAAVDNFFGGVFSNEYLREFTENFRDEAWDAFVEGGFVVAQELDEAIAQSRAGAAQTLGEQRTVLVTPNRESPEETYPLTGPTALLKGQIQQTIHDYRKIYNRDIGEIVGMPAQDWYRAQPHRRKMVIVFQDKERAPWRHPDGRRVRTATYTIPNPRPGLSWRQIKAAAAPYDWGRFRCTANLKSGRQMAVYGSSGREAEVKLRKLLELTTDEIMTLSISEEKDRNPVLRKDSTRMFPGFVTFLIRRPSTDLQGRATQDGQVWDEETRRYALWMDQPPADFVPMLGSGGQE